MTTSRQQRPAFGSAAALLALVVGLTPMGAGCFLSETDVPGTAILRCDTSEDCPSSWSCDTALGRCVAPGGPRFEGTPEVDRTPFGPLSSLAVRFSFDRDVQIDGDQQLEVALADPVLGTPLDGTAFSRIDIDDDDGEFLFSLAGANAAAANLQEGVFAVTVQATSLDGVPSVLVAAFVQWDETPPTIAEPALDLAAPIVAVAEAGGIDAFVINTRIVNATVRLSEDASPRASEPTTVVLRAENGGELAFETISFGPGDVRLRLTPATTRDGTAVPYPGGLYSLVVTAAHDLAGNALAEETTIAQVFVDDTAPTFETFFASPTLASSRDSIVTLCAHLSDPRLLEGAPTSDGSPSPLSVGSSFDGGEFACAREGAPEFLDACGGALDGAVAFSCTLETGLDSRPDEDGAFVIFGFSQDLAGNVGEASVVVQYDTRNPSIVDGNVRLVGFAQSAVQNPFALTSGSSLVVLVSADELVRRPFEAPTDAASAPPAFLVCPPSAASVDNGDGTFSPSASHFELLPSPSVAAPASFYRYDGFVIDAPPPPEVAPPFLGAPDGECALEFWFQDDAGNVATLRATTAAFGADGDDTEVRILVDRSPPAVTSLDTTRLVHIRAPWGFPPVFGAQLDLDNDADSVHTIADLAPNAATIPEVVTSLATSPTIERDVFDPGFVDGVLLLRLYSGPNSPFEVGRILPIGSDDPADPIAEWDQPVVFIEDTAEIWVAAVDFAGNESERVRIDDGAWLATLNGKVAGSTLENPHALFSQPVVSRHLSLAGAAEQSHAQPATEDLEVTTVGSGSFARVGLAGTPSEREFAQMALDTARARIVMFGGSTTLPSGFEILNDQVWERKGENWVQRCLRATPDDCGARPPGRSDHMSAYDAKAGEVLIAGGRVREANNAVGEIVLSPDLWGFDGTSFRRVCGGETDSCSLVARRGGAMAADPLRSQALVVGGCTSMDCSDLSGDVETILYDGRGLSLLGNIGVAPPARHRAALVYNPDADVFVLFGGCADLACSVVLNDTWAFSPSTRSWQQLSPATSVPGGQNPRLVFIVTDIGEELSGSILLLGAQSDTVFQLQNDDWTALTTEAGFAPPSMLGGAAGFAGLGFMAVGDLEERVIVFSGQDETGALSPDTFLLESRNVGFVSYKRVATANMRTPRAALRPNFVEDPEANRFVAHVVGSVPGNLFNEVWTFNGHIWNQICNSITTLCGPQLQFAPLVARGSVATTTRFNGGKGVVLFDEFLGRQTFLSTSILDTPPFSVLPLLPPPPARRPNRSAISRANAAGDVVVFGGEVATRETALFRNSVWSIPPAITIGDEPPLLQAPAMAYDEVEEIAVLATGGSALPAAQDRVWFFDGNQWTEVDAPNGPGPRVDAAMTYDPSREAFVVWGGCRSENDCPGDIWELAVTRSPPSAEWRELPLIDPEGDGIPVGRASPGFATTAAGIVLLGGTLPIIEVAVDDSWRWRSATSLRPGQIFQVDFSASGVGPDANLLRVGAAWNIGGSSPTTTGVLTALWDGGRWRTKAEQSNNANIDNPTPVSLVETAVDDVDIGRLFLGNRRLLHLLATTKGVNQRGTAALRTEGTPSLFVRYQLP